MASLFNYKYLNYNHLKGFENYVYNSKDTSPLSKYLMHPFWNVVVKIVPMWIAPNLLTFVGFLMTSSNGLLLTIYDPEFYASSDSHPEYPPIPSWVWIVCAVFHFVAHTLDGIDGKHARRTKTSGPLGELMDHGMDSWTVFFIPFCIYSIFGRSDYSQPPIHMHLIFWSIYCTFYLSHWEKYNTGILYLPWSYDASQMALFLMYIFTSIYGHQLWNFIIPVLNLNAGQFFELVSYVTSFFLSIPMAFYNVYTCQQRKQKTFLQSIRPLISLILLFFLSTIWAIFSPVNIIELEPRTFYFMVGTIFSNISCRLIVSQMSSTKCDLINYLLYPLSITTFISITKLIDNQHQELRLLRINTIIYTLLHLHYAVCVIRQMCQHFCIYCFSNQKPDKIRSPEQENLGNNNKKNY